MRLSYNLQTCHDQVSTFTISYKAMMK